ncbi:MAG: DegT/DnrJ/EryC1/StrS family aminotransferase [Candidatus Omnitrophica bacterium]|nr:DegT/DnrJ/EryC1/StrS family aminotransferase [Candidatus Omnitrophota bacterium]
MKRKSRVSDFRYDTGAAKVPWCAVGESFEVEDVMEIVRFLLPPAGEQRQKYEEALRKVHLSMKQLGKLAGRAGKLTLGNRVQEAEEAAKKFLKTPYACLLTNATAGFEIGYKYAGLKAGDEVIAPAITFISTILYPLEVGARVVLADVDPVTLNMDPADVARKITPKTKVIIPVHLGGYPVDMAPIMKLAKQRDIVVIEDAAHALGAVYRGKMVGTIGHFGAFSLHEVKNINSLGEGGLLVTNLPFGKKLAQARFVGLDPSRKIPTWLYDVLALKGKGGYFAPGNHSATEIQALGFLLQLKRIKAIIARRRKNAEYLTRRFSQVSGIIPQKLDEKNSQSTYHLYLFQLDPKFFKGNIQEFKKRLEAKGVVQIPHFAPLYKFSIMRQLGYDTAAMEKSCPVAEEAFRNRFTHLPLYPLTEDQVKYMAEAVIECVESMRR